MIEPRDKEDIDAYKSIHIASYVLMGVLTLLVCVDIALNWV